MNQGSSSPPLRSPTVPIAPLLHSLIPFIPGQQSLCTMKLTCGCPLFWFHLQSACSSLSSIPASDREEDPFLHPQPRDATTTHLVAPTSLSHSGTPSIPLRPLPSVIASPVSSFATICFCSGVTLHLKGLAPLVSLSCLVKQRGLTASAGGVSLAYVFDYILSLVLFSFY